MMASTTRWRASDKANGTNKNNISPEDGRLSKHVGRDIAVFGSIWVDHAENVLPGNSFVLDKK